MVAAGGNDLAREARLLLRAARDGVLATAADGHPFASLVTPATAPDGSVLLLLSDLSEHTRHLRADPRCSLLVRGVAPGANPQTAPRVSVSGRAAIEGDEALRRRWVALHPYAAFYAGFADFNLWRLVPDSGHIVAGFGRARSLRGDALCTAPWPGEAAVLAACGAATAARLATGLPGAGWSAVACDADGIDLAGGPEVPTRRIAWPGPATSAAEALQALHHLADAAENGTIPSAGPAPGRTL